MILLFAKENPKELRKIYFDYYWDQENISYENTLRDFADDYIETIANNFKNNENKAEYIVISFYFLLASIFSIVVYH